MVSSANGQGRFEFLVWAKTVDIILFCIVQIIVVTGPITYSDAFGNLVTALDSVPVYLHNLQIQSCKNST